MRPYYYIIVISRRRRRISGGAARERRRTEMNTLHDRMNNRSDIITSLCYK